ncbi:MAG: hypothetical protein WCK17_18780 [Verrucomicrobiota bacterium]
MRGIAARINGTRAKLLLAAGDGILVTGTGARRHPFPYPASNVADI